MKSRLLIFATVSVSVFAFVILSLSSRAFAISNDTSVMPKRNVIIQELKEQRCLRITGSVEQRIQTYEQNKEKHLKSFQKIVSRISDQITSLNSKGYDTTKLSSDLNSLVQMTQIFETKYDKLMNVLKEMETLDCTVGENDLKQNMEILRTELNSVRKQVQDIREFIDTTLRGDLKVFI